MALINYTDTKLKVKLTEDGEEWFASKELKYMPGKKSPETAGRTFDVDQDGQIELTIKEMREKSHGKIDHHTHPLFEDDIKLIIDGKEYIFSIHDDIDVKLAAHGVAFFARLYRELPVGTISPLENPDIVYKQIPTDEEGYIKMSIHDILCRTEIHISPNKPLFEDEMKVNDDLLYVRMVRNRSALAKCSETLTRAFYIK